MLEVASKKKSQGDVPHARVAIPLTCKAKQAQDLSHFSGAWPVK